MLRKPQDIKIRKFSAWMKDMNKLLPQLLGCYKTKRIIEDDSNGIIIHAFPHMWEKQAMMLVFFPKKTPSLPHLICLSTWRLWSRSTKRVPDFGGQSLDTDPNFGLYWNFCYPFIDIRTDKNPY